MRLLVAFLLLSPLAHAHEFDVPPLAAVIGTVEATNIKYSGLGRQNGRNYSGQIKIRLSRVLEQFAVTEELKVGNVISVRVQVQNRLPTWEVSKSQPFIFIVEPLMDGQFKPLAVLPANPSNLIKGDFASCITGAKKLARDSTQTLIVLDSASLMKRAVRSKTMEIPGLMDGSTMEGSVTLLLLLNQEGDVDCASVLQGHPIAYSSALEAIRQFHFLPFMVSGQRHSVLGIISLHFDFRRRPDPPETRP